MNELKVLDFHGKQVIDSRDVAQMVGRNHNELLKTIRSYCDYLDQGEIAQVDFFIESTYVDAQNRTYPNFLVTKKGCDMIANKTTGKKGVLFTAAYVTAFEEMRQALNAAPIRVSFPEGVSLSGLAKLISVTRRVMLDAGSSPYDVCGMCPGDVRRCGLPSAVHVPETDSWTAQLIRPPSIALTKARTPGERPGGESRGIFHFKQGGRAGPLCFFLSMYSPRAHPGPPSPMDSEILIKPLSLWPEYSTGALLIL